MSFTAAALLTQMLRLPVPHRYWVAFSGGVDSHALLHALHAVRDQLPAPLAAVHVHHGLQAVADEWVTHCQTVCDALSIELVVCRVNAQAHWGDSPEAVARQVRYAALRSIMQAKDMVLSAHHQNDQAETVLLQLIRGTGTPGLAGMPLCMPLGLGYLARPLLGFTRDMLEHYAQAHALTWIEDPTNSDTRFDRNYIRQQVMPILNARWPMSAATLARSASHQGEATVLLNELAAIDWHDVQADQPDTLSVTKLQGLLPARQRNVLRYWLKEICHLPLPDTRHLNRIQNELLTARADAIPEVIWSGAEVRRYQDRLYAMSPLSGMAEDWRVQWNLLQPLALPDGVSQLLPRMEQGAGLRAEMLHNGVEVRFRHGGEMVQLPGRRHHHALKKLLQEWGVPPWLRERIPLVYIQGELAQVVGYCLCAPYAASAGERGIGISVSTMSTAVS